MIPDFSITDLLAVLAFLFGWLGFGVLVAWRARTKPNLIARVRVYRRRWIERLIDRDTHIGDAALLGNLLRGVLFFASTTVLILGGLGAVFGAAPKVAEVVQQFPLGGSADVRVAEVKTLIMFLVFIYAFFKFTWSAWQYNLLAILVGGVPPKTAPAAERQAYLESASQMAALAGESYNAGIRAYYFAIPLMAWFLDPLVSCAATVIVSVVLYRREFHSPTLTALDDRKLAGLAGDQATT